MQDSGDRGEFANRNQYLEKLSKEIYENDPLLQKYCNPPKIESFSGLWALKMKSLNTIKKIRPFKHRVWSSYFQEHEDISEGLDSFYE